MLALNAIAFSELKLFTLVLSCVNVLVLAAVLVCLLLAWKLKAEPEKKTRSFFDEPSEPNAGSDQASE